MVVEFLRRVAQALRCAPQVGAGRGVVDEHAVLEVVRVGCAGGARQTEGGLCGLREVRCRLGRHGARRREVGQRGAACAVRAVRARGEVGSQPENVAGQVVGPGGVLEQLGVGGLGLHVAALVQQLPLLGRVGELGHHRVERADEAEGVVARYQFALEIGFHEPFAVACYGRPRSNVGESAMGRLPSRSALILCCFAVVWIAVWGAGLPAARGAEGRCVG